MQYSHSAVQLGLASNIYDEHDYIISYEEFVSIREKQMNILVSTEIPVTSPPWCDVFNSIEFYNLYKTSSSVYISIFHENDLIGCAHFAEVEPGVFKSPYRGTYGAFDFSDHTTFELIKLGIENTLDYLSKKLGAKKITIISAPFAHNQQKSAYQFNVLSNFGCHISNHEINYTVAVNEIPIFEKMMRNNKKRYNKCLRENFSFEQVTNESEFETVYNVIKINRESKGYPVTMTFAQIMHLYEAVTDRLYFFNVKKDGQVVAASVCIRLNDSVLYVFYWGHLPSFEQYSPVVFLAHEIYGFAKSNGFTMVDAGTSSLNGEPNFGLVTFKENLGFTASLRLTYTKIYE